MNTQNIQANADAICEPYLEKKINSGQTHDGFSDAGQRIRYMKRKAGDHSGSNKPMSANIILPKRKRQDDAAGYCTGDMYEKVENHLIKTGASIKYRANVKRKIHSFIRTYGMSEPTNDNWMKLFKKLEEANKSSATKMGYYYAFKHWATALGYPEIEKHKIKVTNKVKKPLTTKEFHKMLDAAKNERDYTILYCLRYLGIRSKELRYAQVSDVALGRSFFYMMDRGQGIKNGCERVVPIHPDLKPIFSKWLTLRAKLVEQGQIKSPYLFPDVGDIIIGEKYFYTLINGIGKRAGLERNISPHMFRHLFITECCRQEMNIQLVQHIAGHLKVETTLKYTHLDEEDAKKALNKIVFA